MTVCIAAIARQARAIVTVSDTMLSEDWRSNDVTTFKVRPLTNGWNVMYAGDQTVEYALRCHLYAWLGDHDNSRRLDSMVTAIEWSYEREIEHVMNRDVFSRYGTTREEFARVGLQNFGPDVFQRIAVETRDVKLVTPLIAFGYDDAHEAHLLVVSGEGSCQIYDDICFHAIGTGDWQAMAYLQLHKDFTENSLGEVCYRMHAAKFVSENSPPVGKAATITTVYYMDGKISVNYGAVESRKYFDDEMARELPDELRTSIEASLTHGWAWSP